MGKLDLTKGQPAYLADKSRKRKKPHESDQGESAAGRPEKSRKPERPGRIPDITTEQINPPNSWTVLNPQISNYLSTSTIPIPMSTIPVPTSTFPINPAPSLVAGPTAARWKVSGPLPPVNPPRPAKKAKVSSSSAFTSAGSSECPLCGGPKHQLRDCLVPKGGVEK